MTQVLRHSPSGWDENRTAPDEDGLVRTVAPPASELFRRRPVTRRHAKNALHYAALRAVARRSANTRCGGKATGLLALGHPHTA
jgi:hypothetical protein